MNKEEEIQVLKEKSKIENKLQRKHVKAENIPSNNILGDCASNIIRNCPLLDYDSVGLQQCNKKCANNENLHPLPSEFLMSEAAVINDDVSSFDSTPPDSSANNAEFRTEVQGFLQQTVLNCQLPNMVSPQIETNLIGKGNSFQQDVEMLLQVCQDVYSQSQTPNFYREKLKSLIVNHIHELLNEKGKLDIEFQEAQKKMKGNRLLITKRLNTIENILCSSTILNKFSKLQIVEMLEKEKRGIQVIKSRLIDEEIQDIDQNSHSKKENLENLNKANLEIDRISRVLKQSQDELKTVKIELQNKINIIRQHAHHEQEIILEITNLKSEAKIFKLQLCQKQNELKDSKRELNDKVDIIEKMAQNVVKDTKDFIKEEVIVLQSQLAGARNELTLVESKISCYIFTLHEKSQHELKLMADVNILQNMLTVKNEELNKVRKELSCKSDMQQKAELEQKVKEKINEAKIIMLQNQLTVAQQELIIIQKEMSCRSVTQQKAQDELNEKEVKVLQDQLTASQLKLEAVIQELNDTKNSTEQRILREQKLSEVGFLEIRMILVKKLGFTDQNNQHFVSYLKEERCRGIVSDIRRLIKDKVQLWKEPISETVIGSNILKVTEKEVHLVIAIACLLKVVPFSASTDFIYSFVAQIDSAISRQHVDSLLKKFPTIFNEESLGAGSSNNNWKYLDLKPIINI